MIDNHSYFALTLVTQHIFQENFRLLFQTMRSSCVMFVAAVCILFLVKLKWSKNKSVYDRFHGL